MFDNKTNLYCGLAIDFAPPTFPRSAVKARSPPPNLHLEIQSHRSNCYGLIRPSFREDGKIKHTTHGRIKGLSRDRLKLIQAAFRGEVVPTGEAGALKTFDSKEYGASRALLKLAKKIGLDRAIYSDPFEPWVQRATALIVGRIVYQGSKLSLVNEWKNTALWELCGVEGKPDVEKHGYRPMDKLLERQAAIQKNLAKKHLKSKAPVLYDITSVYFEGERYGSEPTDYGYNRDGEKGKKRIVVGLPCAENGCPVAAEVFPGNTRDAETAEKKIKEIQVEYGVEELVFVGDRGMATKGNFEKLKNKEGLKTISALTRAQLDELLDEETIQLSYFDEKNIFEVVDPNDPTRRCCLRKNPIRAAESARTRLELLEATRKGLNRIRLSKKKRTPEEIGALTGQVLNKYKIGKYVCWVVRDEELVREFDQDKIDKDKALDGCYVIHSNGLEGPNEQRRVGGVLLPKSLHGRKRLPL